MKKYLLLPFVLFILSNCSSHTDGGKDVVPVSDTAYKTSTANDATNTIVNDSNKSHQMKDSMRTDSMRQ